MFFLLHRFMIFMVATPLPLGSQIDIDQFIARGSFQDLVGFEELRSNYKIIYCTLCCWAY